jgi:hypothetical protein
MGIEINVTSDNGTRLTYGRVVELEMDYQTRQTKAYIGGYQNKESRLRGERPVRALYAEYVMPDPAPENIVAHAYEQLSVSHPDLDMTDV